MNNSEYQQSRAEGLEQQLVDVSAERDLLLQQITADFEELAFLRQLAELLTISEVTWDIVDVATSVLPKLRICIGAEQVVLIQNHDVRDNTFAKRAFLTTGQTVLEELECRRLTAEQNVPEGSQPLVMNNCAAVADYAKYEKLQSFVIARLDRNQKNHGWILALNRASTGYDAPGEPADSRNLTEFGTRQATLLVSVASILATHASNVELFRTKEKLFTDLVRALVRAIEAKDRYTSGHSERVALYAIEIAKSLDLPEHECRRIYLAGLLHDVGKINIPEHILRNPKRLSEEEFATMQRHPDHGWGILQGLEGLHGVLNGVVYHHERWDGDGYPDGLAGEAIPMDSRILSVADAFDAMTSDRPYRDGMPLEKSLAIIQSGAGTQWDPRVVEAFVRSLPAILEVRGRHKLREPAVREKMTINAKVTSASSPVVDAAARELVEASVDGD